MLRRSSNRIAFRAVGCVIVGIALLRGSSAGAAVVTWGSATNISGDADVLTNGTLISACNVGGPDVENTTVNGVLFTALAVSGTSASSGNATLASATNFGSNNNLATASPPFSRLSSGYQALLSSVIGSFAMPYTLTFSGLTTGDGYELEFWSNTSNGNNFTTTVTAGNSVTVGSDPSRSGGGLGQFAVGTFTADATSEIFTFSTLDQDLLNGFQLRQTAVPEPCSAALLGVASMAMTLFRARKERGR